jgi:TPR repeat protein
MVEFAVLQFNGVGVPRDRAAAAQWFRKAAAKGNAVAQNRLAHILAEGLGVEANLAEAREWRAQSREAGLNDPSLDSLSSASAPAKPTAVK